VGIAQHYYPHRGKHTVDLDTELLCLYGHEYEGRCINYKTTELC